MRLQIMDVVGMFLPDPQKFVHSALEVLPPECHDGKLLGEIVPVHNAEALESMGRCAVFPVRTDFLAGIRIPVVEDIGHIFNEEFICVTHTLSSPTTSEVLEKMSGDTKSYTLWR